MKTKRSEPGHWTGLGKSMLWILCLWIGAQIGNAHAGVVLDPVSRTVAAGEMFTLDVVLSGDTGLSITDSLRFDVSYDRAVIAPSAVAFGGLFSSGSTSWSVAPLWDTLESLAVQVSGLLLFKQTLVDEIFATITFQALAPGWTEVKKAGSGQGGCCSDDDFMDLSLSEPARITVVAEVPEPSSLGLLCVALAVTGGALRRRI